MKRRNPRWNWDFPKYSPNWDTVSELCKRRDGYRCKKCGARGFKIGGNAILHAAHIVSKSQGGRDVLTNLQTLCSACHAKEHSHMRKRK